MDLLDYLREFGMGDESDNAGGGAQGEFDYAPEALAAMQEEGKGTLAPGWGKPSRSVADAPGAAMNLLNSGLSSVGINRELSDSPEEWALSRQRLAPILEGLDNMTVNQGSKIPAGLAAIGQGAWNSLKDGQDFDFWSNYNRNRGLQKQAHDEWEQSIPSLTMSQFIPALRGVSNVGGAVGSPVLGALLGKIPGYTNLATKGLAGNLVQAGIPLSVIAMMEKYAPGLDSVASPKVDMQQLTEAAGLAGPNQNSPMSEKADFRVGDGEWQNGLDSRVGKGFSKAAPGTAQRASERYQSTLEPHRQDQIRQLYGQAVQKYLTANAKLAEQVTNPEEKRKLLKLINKNAHETGLMMVPASERHNFPYVGEADEQAPAPGTEEVSQDGEGYGTLGGMALLVGGGAATGAAIALARKMGVPIPTAKAIIQSMMGKGGKLPPLEKAIAGGKNVPWKQLDIKGFANKGVNVRMPTGGPTGLNALNAPQKEIVSRMNALQKLSSPAVKRPAGGKVDVNAVFERLMDKGILP